jgi:hypothetical protein
MKKIALIAAALLLSQGALMAQKKVAEKDVKVSYVKDFQRQVKEPTNVQWYQIDENTFKVTFLDEEKSRMAMVFSNKGMETHYIVENSDYYPKAIVDYVKAKHPGFNITDLWARKARNKMTYQARISKTSGILWWKKEKDAKILNFEVEVGDFVGVFVHLVPLDVGGFFDLTLEVFDVGDLDVFLGDFFLSHKCSLGEEERGCNECYLFHI